MANKNKEKTTKSVSATSYMSLPKPNIIAQEYKPTSFTETYTADPYQSKYTDQIERQRQNLQNWSYDPLKDASYQSLAKVYSQRGNIAAKNSLGDAAALNGGYGSSFAVSAAQQARNQYNQELASMVPQLEQAAYGRASDAYNMLMQADQSDYAKYRDAVGDNWNQYLQRYQQWLDNESLNQFLYNAKQNEANAEWDRYFNSRQFDLSLKQYKDAQKAKGSSGGGGGGGGSRTSGYLGLVNGPDINLDGIIDEADDENKKNKKTAKKGGTGGGGGYSIKTTNRLMTK